MILHLQNLTWDCPSPSFYRLRLPKPAQDAIDISFLGAVGEWCLFIERNGHVQTRLFSSRDDAIGMVAQAFHNEGVI